MLDFFDRNSTQLSKLFGLILLTAVIMGAVISYNNTLQLQLGIEYLKTTFKQSSSNFDAINQSRIDHQMLIQDHTLLIKSTSLSNRYLENINKTLAMILSNQTSVPSSTK